MNETDADNVFNEEEKYTKTIINELMKHYNELQSLTLNEDICISNFSSFVAQVVEAYVLNFHNDSEFIRSGILEQVKNTFTYDDFSKAGLVIVETESEPK